MEFQQNQINKNNEGNWQEAIFLLEKISQKIENYKVNSKTEIKSL